MAGVERGAGASGRWVSGGRWLKSGAPARIKVDEERECLLIPSG
jgi:hypothetical protein